MNRRECVGMYTVNPRELSIILIYTYLNTNNTRYIYYALNNIDYV
jgi:hypothetical protein